MNRDQAAEEFARMLYRVGIEQAYRTFFASIDNPVGHNKEQRLKISHWYASKGFEEQQLINTILRKAMALSVFGIAVNFDGDAGYEEVDNKFAEFVVSLRMYGSLEEEEVGAPTEFVEICPTNGGENIHDIFMSLVDEANGES